MGDKIDSVGTNNDMEVEENKIIEVEPKTDAVEDTKITTVMVEDNKNTVVEKQRNNINNSIYDNINDSIYDPFRMRVGKRWKRCNETGKDHDMYTKEKEATENTNTVPENHVEPLLVPNQQKVDTVPESYIHSFNATSTDMDIIKDQINQRGLVIVKYCDGNGSNSCNTDNTYEWLAKPLNGTIDFLQMNINDGIEHDYFPIYRSYENGNLIEESPFNAKPWHLIYMLHHLTEIKHKAVKIQALFRGHKARKNMKKEKAAALKIQRQFRHRLHQAKTNIIVNETNEYIDQTYNNIVNSIQNENNIPTPPPLPENYPEFSPTENDSPSFSNIINETDPNRSYAQGILEQMYAKNDPTNIVYSTNNEVANNDNNNIKNDISDISTL